MEYLEGVIRAVSTDSRCAFPTPRTHFYAAVTVRGLSFPDSPEGSKTLLPSPPLSQPPRAFMTLAVSDPGGPERRRYHPPGYALCSSLLEPPSFLIR